MPGDTGQVHSSACELDKEQHIYSPEEDRVDAEEVAGQDAAGLLAQERPPAGCGASGAGSRP
jgi:hypothetical protein